MFAIAITGPDDFRESLTTAWEELTIGRAGHNDLVLAHPSVSMRHVRLLYRGGYDLVLFDLRSELGTWVDDVHIQARGHAIAPGTRVRIGDYTLVFTWVAHEELPVELGDVEAGLIDTIENDRDPAARVVYADWLDENGQAARAEFLRLEQTLLALQPTGDWIAFDIRRSDLHVRMRELATVIDLRWRARLACPTVERCARSCQKNWSTLSPTQRPAVRHCDECRKDVHYCASLSEAGKIATTSPVVIDLLCPRRASDL